MSPCFTPLSTAISPESWSLKVTQAFMFQYSFLNMFTKVERHPIMVNIFHSASLLTMSKALVKSTKT